jgi:ribose transport system substrate-binding protein
MKKGIALLLTLCFILSFTACSSSDKDGASDKKVKITFVTPLLGHPVWLDAKKGYEDAAKEFGFETQWVGPEGENPDAMVKLIETALVQKVDGIISCPFANEAFIPIYTKAQDQGVIMMNTCVDSPEETRTGFVGTDTVKAGQLAAEELAKKMNGKARVCVMQSSLDAANQNSEFDAFKAVLDEKYPDMEVVVRESNQVDMTVAIDKFNAILKNDPTINAIYCLEANGGIAAAQVLLEQNRVGQVTILAVDDMEQTLKYIRDGVIWATKTQDFYEMGYMAAKYIMDKLEGKEVPSFTDSGTVFVTTENIDTYKNQK